MKTIFVFIVVCLLVGNVFSQEGEGAVGEYQLVSAVVEMSGKGTVVPQHVVFRIDTKTGMTWTYVVGEGKDGKMHELWSRIREVGEQVKMISPQPGKTP